MALDKFTQVTKSGIVTTLEFDCTSVRATGVVTATKFVGPSEGSTGSFTGAVSITDTTNATSITTGALKITGGVGIGMSLHVGGNVSIGGTLTYEDVTNVDSVGLITARSGINVSGGELKVGTAVTVGTAGVVTATSFSGDGSALTGITGTTINANTNNYLITGTGTANTLQGESGLTFDGTNLGINQSSPGDLLEIHPASNLDGLTFKDTGDVYPALTFDINRSGSDQFLGNIRGLWNGTTVANIILETGSDTTNKDDGVITFRTASAGSTTERLRIDSSGNVNFGAVKAVAFPSGTGIQVYHSANPRIKLTNDTTGNSGTDGTQLYLSSSDFVLDNKDSGNIIFHTNAAEKLRITSAGLVGIGTNVPARKLHLHQDGSSSNYLTFTNTTTGVTASNGFTIGIDASENAILNNYGAKNIEFLCNGSERLLIASDGHVAIGGYGDPGSILDVRENKDGAETRIRLFNTDNGDTTTQTAALYLSPDSRGTALAGLRAIKENPDFSTNAGRDISLSLNVTQNNSQLEALRILSDGKVGIGITAPISELHIESSTGGEIVLSDSDSVRKNGIKCVSSDNLMIFADENNEGGTSFIKFSIDGSEKARILSTGDVEITSGNLIMGTSGKGIDFSATSDAGGMTNEVLDDFETGTWTATSREGTLNNAATCRYTKIGNMVWVNGAVNTFSERSSTVDVGITNLPFTVSENAMGSGVFYRVANTDDAEVGTIVNTNERIQFLVSSQGGSESWYYIDYEDLNGSDSQIKFSVWYRTTQ